MAKKVTRTYTREFKEQAVRLAETMGSCTRAAKQLGVPMANVHNWKAKSKDGKLKDSKNNMSSGTIGELPEQELKRLRKENEELKQVNYILKRAAAFFSQDHLK